VLFLLGRMVWQVVNVVRMGTNLTPDAEVECLASMVMVLLCALAFRATVKTLTGK